MHVSLRVELLAHVVLNAPTERLEESLRDCQRPMFGHGMSDVE